MAASIKTMVSLMYDGFSDTALLFSNKRLDLCLLQSNDGTSSWEDRKSWVLLETHIKSLSDSFFFLSHVWKPSPERRSNCPFRCSKQTRQPLTTGCSLLKAGGKQHKPSERVLNKQPYEGKCVWLYDQKPPSVWVPRCPRLISPCKVR